ncbi:MAG: TonB-dependent receptor, partial [Bacteroidales bacterium]|nr:TonB-dependent receptor [Bacteroidales bacterium]
MKSKAILLLIFCAIQASILGQNSMTVSGYVHDDNSGESLIGATIIDLSTEKGTVTNNYGFFSISGFSKDTLHLLLSYIGYTSKQIHWTVGNDSILNISLALSNVELEEVTVRAGKTIQDEVQMSVSRLNTAQVKQIPALGGEVDILKAYQLMPGIAQGGEGSSDYFVRGGGHDQNLILLDDVPLYYVNHLGGFVSVFNPDIVKDSKIIKGGFPARYGNRLS